MNERGEILFLEDLPRNAIIVEHRNQTVGEFLRRSAIDEFAGAPYLSEEANLFF